MTERFRGERTLMRVFIGESDKYEGKPLYEALLERFRKKGLSLDLPLIIEVVEDEATIQGILPDLDQMIGGGLITLERANVILYRPA